MNVLWQHLQKMAKAQLFNGGYLAGPSVRSLAESAPRATEAPGRTISRSDRGARLKPAPCA